MAGENERFVAEFANPHSWLLAADNLHNQAVAIYARRSSASIMAKVDASGNIVLTCH